MNVRMVLKVLSPGMEHAQQTDVGTQMLRLRATSSSVAALVRKSRSYRSFLFCNTSKDSSCGKVKTRWK